MDTEPDYGESTYRGSGRLQGKKALITGGDSGIGRAVAIAFAREGADVAIAYLDEMEDDDAHATQRLVEEAGRRCELFRCDLSRADNCRKLVRDTVAAFGRIEPAMSVNRVGFGHAAKTWPQTAPAKKWR